MSGVAAPHPRSPSDSATPRPAPFCTWPATSTSTRPPYSPVLRGRLDRLDLSPGQCLVLELSGLAFCDSSGITALLAARQHALAADADIVLAAVPANLLRVLTLVGLDQVFTLRPDFSAAS
ncbi:STAS domain-containing protein [Streptomyces sp. NPDC006265]|uniref:STAS domain-containing protein n=1 Tax=Streptomyces sp. NPDC006265 TaxID=3156740 RepID=UPI0033BD028B